MKNIFFGLALMIVMPLSVAGLPAQAQDCPRGLVNDPYPGECGRYVDSNNDGYCDHSQDLDALEAVGAQTGAGQAEVAASETEGSESAPQEINSAGKIPAGENPAPARKPVDFFMWQIALGILAAYLASLFLVKRGKIAVFGQRKFWNFVLLILFLAAAFTSIILLLEMKYRIVWRWPFDIEFWHIESGWAMIVVAFLHAAWHWPYYKTYFPKKPDK